MSDTEFQALWAQLAVQVANVAEAFEWSIREQIEEDQAAASIIAAEEETAAVAEKEARKLPHGIVSSIDTLELTQCDPGSIPNDLLSDLNLRRAINGITGACSEIEQDALASALLRSMRCFVDNSHEHDVHRVRHYSNSTEVLRFFLDEACNICLIQDYYGRSGRVFETAALSPISHWMRAQRIEHVYETFTNPGLHEIDVNFWSGRVRVYRDCIDVIRVPYQPQPDFLQWQGTLILAAFSEAQRLELKLGKNLAYPLLEYLLCVLPTTTCPMRPYTPAEKEQVRRWQPGRHRALWKVDHERLACHSAVWTLWSARKKWPPWVVCWRLIRGINSHQTVHLEPAILEKIMSYVGDEFRETWCFLEADFEILGQWEWWWQLFQCPKRIDGTG